MQTDEPATTITHDSNSGNAMMANCYYANKLHGGYFTVENKRIELQEKSAPTTSHHQPQKPTKATTVVISTSHLINYAICTYRFSS
ncbi:uncharacterized protein Dyak_GE28711 [Drosophila yakuba]|uniref:Uncharacterized protein n=1 Tax=Drosophila yakuba TaxID=7245 RepID=A0A0R1DNU4_DROYA|nr:uncharacterized protein Dyak_GE28711 [Drosophila yakuba]